MGDRMQIDEARSELSSSSISSPPTSPQHGLSDTIHVARRPSSLFTPTIAAAGVVAASQQQNHHHHHPSSSAASGPAPIHVPSANAAASATTTTAPPTTAQANGTAEKVRRPRKKKEVGPDGNPISDGKPKEKRPRKPRESKDAKDGGDKPATTSTRKKVKVEEKPAGDAPLASRQPLITEMVGSLQRPSASSPAPPTEQSQAQPPSLQQQAAPQHQRQASDGVGRVGFMQAPPSHPPAPRPFSSGRNYDPIRGSTQDYMPARVSTPATNVSTPPPSGPAPPASYRASASPSIASLIEPSITTRPSAPSSFPPQASAQNSPLPRAQQISSPPSKPAATNMIPAPSTPLQSSPPATHVASAPAQVDGAMDIDSPAPKPSVSINPPSIKSSSSPGPSSKPVRPTPEPAIKGTGSGLLSSSDILGGPSSSTDTSERRGANIDLHIPLNPKGGNAINIAHEIVKKYGRDAINPRAAAHREQLLRVAAEQSRLEGGAGHTTDDMMSVDLMSDADGDTSNVDMAGTAQEDEGKSIEGVTATGRPRKRRKKVEEYDKEDDFIDDTELAWQEQAAVAKDGFFVYSGPLVPEGEKVAIEASGGTATSAPRGSRGRGRGRGGRVSAAAAAGSTHSSLAESKTSKEGTGPSNGGAGGSATAPTKTRAGRGRGSGITRKPRITKADRERMEMEKVERERSAAATSTPISAAMATAAAAGTPTGNTNTNAKAAAAAAAAASPPRTGMAANTAAANNGLGLYQSSPPLPPPTTTATTPMQNLQGQERTLQPQSQQYQQQHPQQGQQQERQGYLPLGPAGTSVGS